MTAEFKGNIVTRYTFEIGDYDAFVQGSAAYEGERSSDLNQADNLVRGNVPKSTLVDLSAGIRNESYSVDVFIKNVTDEDAAQYYTSQCATGTCGAQNYGVRLRPRTFGVRFSQEF